MTLAWMCLIPVVAEATEEVFYGGIQRQQLLISGASFEVSDNFPTVDQTLSVKDVIWFSIDEDTILKSSTFTHWVDISIEKYNASNSLVGTDTIRLTVNFNPAEGTSYTSASAFSFSDVHRFKVKILTKSSSFPAFMRLEGKIIINRKYPFDCDATPDLIQKTHAELLNTTTNVLQVGWQKMDGAEEYDLEWSFYDTLSPTITLASGSRENFDTLFHYNSTRITTSQTWYDIPLVYPKGRIYWRIRGVRYYNSKRQTSNWTSVKSSSQTLVIRKEWYWVNPHEQDFNWQMKSVFAEEGKKSQSINFFDGSLRSRQKVVKSDAINMVIASETVYDSLGRPAIQVMPAPVSFGTGSNDWTRSIKYNASYSATAGSAYYSAAHLNFDSEDCNVGDHNPAPKMDTVNSAVGRYYSSNNPYKDRLIHKFTPASEGYPFSVTEYMPDGSGRIRRQGGVGDKFQLGSGHETKYYYSKPDQTELDRLFGNEAGEKSHYQKNAVVDPNGQISVSYIDAHGRTIATALAGAVPQDGGNDRLKQLDNYAAASRIKKDLLSNVRDGMALTSTYSLLVTDEGDNDSIIYTFYPKLQLSIDSCLSEVHCYDCKYDLEIKILSECGETIVDFSKSNFTSSSFDLSCETLPDTIYRLFIPEPGLQVGQYQVTKTIRINQSALDYYANDYLSHLVCIPTPETLQNTFIGDTSCHKTCEECYAALGTLTQFRDNYLDGFTVTTHTDTVNSDNAYYRAVEACSEQCDESAPSECDMMLEMMLMDVTPGGQYARYDTTTVGTAPDEDLIFTDSNDETSVFYLGSESRYPYQRVVDVGGANANLYLDAYGQIDYVYRADSIKVRIDSLSINEFITYFKPSWAETLVKAHPEYCLFLCCKENSSPSWDSLFSVVDTYEEALELGFMPLDSLIAQDPFFQANDSLEVQIQEWWDTHSSTSTTSCGTPVSLTEIITSIIFCGGNLPCDSMPGGGCTADNNIYWELVRAQYQTIKSNLKWSKIRGGACPEIDFGENEFCKNFNELCFGCDDAGNPYTDKQPRVLLPSAPRSDANELYATLDSANVLVQGICDSTCIGMAEQWIHTLSLTCQDIAESDSLELAELMERFVAVCRGGCDLEHPFGSVTTNGTPTVYGDIDLQTAIDSIFFGGSDNSCNTGCSAKLIDFPGTYESSRFLASPVIVQTQDSCACSRLEMLMECADTMLLTIINQSSDIQLTAEQLAKLQNGCSSSCHYMDEAITIPPILECNTCKTHAEVEDEWDSYLAGCGDTSTVAQKSLVAAYLNQVLGLNRSFEDYLAFLTTTPTFPECWYLCPRARFPQATVDSSCVSLELESGMYALANLSYERLLDSMRQVFVRNYLNKCLGSELTEQFEARLTQAEYHYTLYYYDQADNLVRTVPPKGVNLLTSGTDLAAVAAHRANPANTPKYPAHGLVTRYWYNSLNQVVRDSTPDRGDTDFWYDRLGRMVLSQNAKQRLVNDYTYSEYDFLGRVIETGRIRKTAPAGLATIGTIWDYTSFSTWLTDDVVGFYEVTHSYFDDIIAGSSSLLAPYFPNPYGSSGQENLRNRIASVSFEKIKDSDPLTYDYATHYSYDIGGNVKQMVQDIPELDIDTDANYRFKRITYDYDLISGKVNYVFYQKDSVDQFIHHYVYDADNRIQFVETSRDSLFWDRDAGPMGRTEIGERRVQGLDYAYTLQGWLKGVNASALSLSSPGTADFTTRDMGRDGKSGNTGDFARNKMVGRDAMAFTLGYYYGDYRMVSTTSGDTFEMKYANNADFHLASSSLYNGNIRHAVYTIAQLNVISYARPEGYTYKYDQLNRLIGQRTRVNYDLSDYEWSTTAAELERFREDVSYDPNGNILKYLRNGHRSSQYLMDSLTYHYETNTNKLNYIDDKQTGALSVYKGDMKDQAPNNYAYDAIGNLVQDTRDSVTSITWTNAHKIDSIAKTDRSIWFGYDAMQNRVVKHSKANSSDQERRTYYIRDAQGNIIATYQAYVTNEEGVITWDSMRLGEQHIYGSTRVGMALPNLQLYPLLQDTNIIPIFVGAKRYELANHLGNVLVVLSDRKHGKAAGGSDIQWFDADVLASQQYFPFGMLMPDTSSVTLRRQYQVGGYDHRFGFNGMEGDDEVKGDDNQLDYGMRIYDPRLGRFLSLDPIIKSYESPYVGYANNPILLIDPSGMDTILYGMYDGVEYARKKGEGKSPIFIVDETNSEFSKNDPWLRSTPLLYNVGKGTKNKGLTGLTFRHNHPLKNVGTKVGEQVYYEDLIDLTDEFDALVQDGIKDFLHVKALYDTRTNFRLTSPKERAFESMVTDGAKWDLKSDIVNDGTPSYAAKVIGEWSILNGTLRRYDDYGNISYGIFGIVAGFTEQRMLDAADLNQRMKDATGKTNGKGDEDRDKYMISTGVYNANSFINAANKK